MAKTLIVFAWSMLVVVSGYACDACGCSISGQGIGLLTNYRTSVAGVRYFHVPFHAAPTVGNTKDHFHTVEVFLRYQINSRIKLMATQPYRLNVRNAPDAQSLRLDGISDTRLLGSYALLDKWVGTQSRLYWEVGTGIKLPTGKHNDNLHDQNLPDNFNTGNGSWGYLFQTGMVFSQKQFGVSLNANAQLNGETSTNYRYGNQFSGSLLFFMEKSLGEKGRIVPLAGISVEMVTKDTRANGNHAHGTGGRGAFATVGLNAGYDQWQLGASYSKPITQNYSDGEVLADGRFSLELNYFF